MKRVCQLLVLGVLSLILSHSATAAQLASKTDSPRAERRKAAESKGGTKSRDPQSDRTPQAKPPAVKEQDGAKTDGAKDKPATYKVKKRTLKIEITLDGIFEGRSMAEIAMHGKEWAEYEILKAVEHGTAVKPGDFLIALDTEKIDRTIADLQRDQALGRLALQEAELQVQLLQSTMPLDIAQSERARRVAEQDYVQFTKVDRPLSERVMNFMVKMSEDFLAYEKEELRQLEKMYKADDLVEETEEIILKRARDSVERATFNLERAKTERETILKLSLPRAEEMLKLNGLRQEIDWKRSQATIPNAGRRMELALEKLKIERGRSEERLQKLLADREQMTVKSPIEGVVYYGRCNRGKWSNVDNFLEKLRRGGRVQNEDVFMTVVASRPLVVRTTIPERQLQHVKPGLQGFVQPTGFSDVKLTAIIERISAAPLGSQGFDATVTVAIDESTPPLVPGMSCELRLVPYCKSDALTIPAAALGTDDQDPRKFYVCLPSKDGKPAKRPVTLGKRADRQVEILKGLAEGDEILAECPKE